ncbi:response regulator transcription factor [Paenibacillus eucommiae]|uniref:Two-component system response regulator YesN n=1 Tax=Paenibacillus eucommiae TaxID=1355755 RepID=A0ABS4ITQ3_9BACL|nr:response regulator [Paenibacillus eucommiae]MBP1990949.1 two-component system response regulator YesN [Paenibacillus eucommiae]
MYRVLIVDDEPIIVNSLYQLLREAAHLELEACRAYNVYEALDYLQQTRIDVVISDIRMPGMSGIELHKQIMQSWPRCKVIFLTGYNDFDYVRHAIRTGGVVDYVLKNEDDHIILAAVKKAFAELERVEDGADYMLNAKKKLQLAIPALQKNTLFDLMQDASLSLKEIGKRFNESEIPLFPEKRVLLVAGKVDVWQDDLSESDRTLLIYACQNIAEEYLSPTVAHVSVVFESYKFLWFMQPRDLLEKDTLDLEQEKRAWQNMKSRVYGIMEAVQETCGQLLKLPVSFVIGREAYAWEQLGSQFDHLKTLLGQGFNGGHELLIQDSESFGFPKGTQMLQPVSESQQSQGLITSINQYIQQHLGGDLSLTKLSTIVHHSPTYLSRLYKRMTGTMLSDYITEERMKKAKQQLAETSVKIQEIATNVGYEAAPQFNRSFKKMFKMTPQEYRDSFQKKNL